MGFNIDYSQASQGGRIAPGTYECIIKDPHEAASRAGSPYLSIPMVIRNDLEQKYKNAIIWYAIRKKHVPTPADTALDGYSAKQIAILSRAVKLPNGKHYSCISEWLKDLDRKLLRMEVKPLRINESGQEQQDYGFPAQTQCPYCSHVMKERTAAVPSPAEVPPPAGILSPAGVLPPLKTPDGFTQVDEDDLPF